MEYKEYESQNPETVLLLHGGGLSWWNYREVAQLLAERFRVILPCLDGHPGSARPFVSIEECAAGLIEYIDRELGGSVCGLGGLSLGGQVVVELLTQRPDICKFALIESALVKPMGLTHALTGPAVGMSYGLIRKRWFAKWQAAYLGIPEGLFEDYYRDTCRIGKEDMIAFLKASSAYCIKPALQSARAGVHIVYGGKEQAAIKKSAKLLHQMIPRSATECLAAYRHGDLSINHPAEYAQRMLDLFSQAGK